MSERVERLWLFGTGELPTKSVVRATAYQAEVRVSDAVSGAAVGIICSKRPLGRFFVAYRHLIHNNVTTSDVVTFCIVTFDYETQKSFVVQELSRTPMRDPVFK